MQIIHIKNFGTVLVSRPAGVEAFRAIRPEIRADEPVQIDFEGVLAVTPSWLDEFLIHLTEYNGGKVELLPTKNASVLAALPVLGEARDDYVAAVVQNALRRMK